MSQNPLFQALSGVFTGTQVATTYNLALDSLLTNNSGASAPMNQSGSVPEQGQFWVDTSAAKRVLRIYDGANWLPIATFDPSAHVWAPVIGGGSNSIASAATCDLGSLPETSLLITGSTTITSFGSSGTVGMVKLLTFVSTPTLTYNATSLLLPGSASYSVTGGDSAIAICLGSGNWRILLFPVTGQSVVTPLPYRNVLINGDFVIDQHTGGIGAATLTTSPSYPAPDMWYGFSTGANSTLQIYGPGLARGVLISGATSVTGQTIGQRIPAENSYYLNNGPVMLSAIMSNNVATSVTWALSYCNSVNNFASVTAISSGTFSVNSSPAKVSTGPISIPSAATGGLLLTFTANASSSSLWLIRDVQLEPGNYITPFDRLPYEVAYNRCLRYFWDPGYGNTFATFAGSTYSPGASNVLLCNVSYPVLMFQTPTITARNVSYTNCSSLGSTTASRGGNQFLATATAAGYTFAQWAAKFDAQP